MATTPPARNGRVPHKKLTWSDFRVDDDAEGLSAQTQTFVTYTYTGRAVRRAGETRFTATVAKIRFDGGFDRNNSWRRSEVRADDLLLLEHEQGHLDLNEIKVRQLRAIPLTELPAGSGATSREALADLEKKLRTWSQWHLDDLEKTQKQYDEETQFGTKREVQRQWTTRLQNTLRLQNKEANNK
ncbi:MAG: hypothetical protein OHK0029_37300 [Armatimonadaceae bacterium]